MDPIQPITQRIPNIPSVERVSHRVDPEPQKRAQQQRQREREREQDEPGQPEEDDGLPHIDICA